ncbi:hypothetical protein Pcinc_012369 [Petrolisthes cinctipes]|uniref:Uncharacterized protein n=1 Tax=Petrolisthes cinctipes TaxID=88211 RepID=A0AAE1FZ34_PETCI|nr:hypothetical protein Pcinc_012369 [Petrolisthes cinctipes]
MRNDTEEQVVQHKEEMKARKEADAKDREMIQKKLQMYTDPLDPKCDQNGIVNIVTGLIGSTAVNVDDAVGIGTQHMKKYEASWPDGFDSPMTSKVVTMAKCIKHTKKGSSSLFDTELIYARVIGMAYCRDLDLRKLFQYELAPVPTSMFEDSGVMRITKTKSTLKRKLQVAHSAPSLKTEDVLLIDG